MQKFRNKYFGTKDFYKRVLILVLPMIAQNMITNFVSMLDNVMVGMVGTAQMSGVSIVNQFIFVFNLTIFGGVSGASIFGTQYYGKKDAEGQRYTVRFRMILTAIVILAFAIAFSAFGSPLIKLFLSKDSDPAMVADTLMYGKQYLHIIMFSMIPFGFGQAYASVIRECGETKIPMIGAMTAIGVNLVLDYGLIFGHFGMPKMGVAGAAIATVIAKTVEAFVMIAWAHLNPQKNPYIRGLYRSLAIPKELVAEIIVKGCPLLVNEFMWSVGMSVIAQLYSCRGIEVVAARNIASTLTNLFNVIYLQMGGATGIIVGQLLGAGKLEEARDTDNKMVMFSQIMAGIVLLLMLPVAKLFPMFYNTEESIRSLATFYILVMAFATPLFAYTNVTYFTLRCGGKTGITFLFDFGFSWFVQIPVAFVLTHFTGMEIHMLMFVVTFMEAFKVVIGYFMIRSDIWVNNIVE